jgi:hypothetical protein
MPIYETKCPAGHVTEHLRAYARRDDPTTCACGLPAERIMSIPHCVPDGMYSYAPNVGNADAFERRQVAMRDGVKIMKKEG